MTGEQKSKLTCPVCAGKEFKKNTGKIDGTWGVTAHNVVMMICAKCKHMVLFSEGETIFDFD